MCLSSLPSPHEMEMRERVVVKEGERWNERLALKRCKSPRERLRFQLICISNEEGEWKRDRCDEEKLRERDGEVVKTAAAERDGWQIEEKVQTDESHITSRLETHKEQHGGKRERYSRGLMLNYKTFILLEVFIVAFLVVFFLKPCFWEHRKIWLMACPQTEKKTKLAHIYHKARSGNADHDHIRSSGKNSAAI